ncbi:MAG: hypothetical protein ABIC82_06180 [bacterium]
MDQKSKRNLIIRLIVYPIVIVIVFFLCRVLWVQYTKDNPEQAKKMHILGMKLRGIEYCETPEEAVRLYAEALVNGDREEALIYIYRPKYEHNRWDGAKKRFYRKTDEELKEEGEDILNGYMREKNSETAEWVIIHNINGEIIKGSKDIWNTGYNGWKIH